MEKMMMEERKCQDGILKMLVTTSHNISQHLILRHPLCIHRRSQTLNPHHHTLFRLQLLQPPLLPLIKLQHQNSRIYQLMMQRHHQKLINLPLLLPPLPPLHSFFFIRDKFIRDSAWIFVRN